MTLEQQEDIDHMPIELILNSLQFFYLGLKA